MLSLVVLISGGGSNLRALLEASEHADFPARVVAIGADRDADGFAHAEEFGIPTFSLALSSFPDRESWGDAMLEQIRVWQPDLVILSGFMKLFPPRVVEALSPNLINTHPAFLQMFQGAEREYIESDEAGREIPPGQQPFHRGDSPLNQILLVAFGNGHGQ